MKSELIPNTVDREAFNDLGIDAEEFTRLQIKYKNILESTVKSVINVNEIDSLIESGSFEIPSNLDSESFYYKYSTLNSKYFYIRNNIHIERLTPEEISALKNEEVGEEFVLRTINRVVTENSDITCYGAAIPTYFAPSKDLVLAFCYRKSKCTIKQNREINEKMNEAFNIIKPLLEGKLNIKVSKIMYDGYEKSSGINR